MDFTQKNVDVRSFISVLLLATRGAQWVPLSAVHVKKSLSH